jgi:hypothetical protein
MYFIHGPIARQIHSDRLAESERRRLLNEWKRGQGIRPVSHKLRHAIQQLNRIRVQVPIETPQPQPCPDGPPFLII